ncbi:5798_t:CDS:2, partial [Ambispora leptoticha]
MQNDLDEAYCRLTNMAKLIEEHYGQHLISPNIYLSLHIKQCCLNYGPPYAYTGSYSTNNWLIEPELMRILMKNIQVEYRIKSVNENEAKLLLDQVLLLLDKKVCGSLKMTEHFESKDLVVYLEMANKIDTVSVITGKERYLGEMIKLVNRDIILSNNIYQNLKEYYSILYDISPLNNQDVTQIVTQFEKLKIGAEIYESKIASRYENRSYIRAKFLAYSDNNVDIYPGQIQFFFQHKFNENTHHLAYVRWYRPYTTRRFFLSLKNDEHCDVEIWHEKFYKESRDCIIPIQRILG